MRRIRSDHGVTDNQGAPETIMSEPVLPALRRRRSPERTARIPPKRRILEVVQTRRVADERTVRGRME